MRVNHVNIVTRNMERCLAFYVGLLEMRVTFETELTGEWIERVTHLSGVSARCVFCQPSGGGARFELLEYQAPAGDTVAANMIANTIGLRHVALEVNDLDALYQRLLKANIAFLSAPVTVPFPVTGVRKRLCYCHDPDGAIVEFAEYQAEPAQRSASAPPISGN